VNKDFYKGMSLVLHCGCQFAARNEDKHSEKRLYLHIYDYFSCKRRRCRRCTS